MTSIAAVEEAHAPAILPLRGREVELAQAAAALEDQSVRLLIARGPAGVGKTALLRQVMAQAQAQGALLGSGKYAQSQRGLELEPLVAALEEALAGGLDQLFDPQAGLEDLFRTLGAKRDVFTSLGSQLLRSADNSAWNRPFTAAEADERVVQALIQCLRWLEGFGAPVLLLIDDWGRAGTQAQRVYARIASEPALRQTRLLATERQDEIFAGALPPGAAVLQVGPLARAAQKAIAQDILKRKAGVADEVLDLLGPAAGTPFDLIQSIHLLAADGAIVSQRDGWRLDRTVAAPAVAGAAAESVVRHVAQAGAGPLQLAQLLAVYGDQAPVADLARAARLEDAAFRQSLTALVDSGLVRIRLDVVEYAHDRLRAEVLRQLTLARKSKLAAVIAETLRGMGVDPADGLRGAAMLWRRRDGGLQAVDAPWWQAAFTKGAERARERGDREAAESFMTAALQLAERNGGPGFALSAEAAFAAVARADHEEALRWGEEMIRAARTAAERAAADEMRVFARRMSGDLDGALETAREILARVGVKLPRRPTFRAVAAALMQVLWLNPRTAAAPLAGEALEREAPVMRATNGIGSLLFERSPLMAVILVTKAVPSRMVYGTAAGAATYALMCCAFGLYTRAARWAEIADQLQGPEQPLRAVAKQYSSSFGHVFVRPRAVTRSRGAEMEALAYAGGDLAVAAYGNRDKVLDALFSEDRLEDTTLLADESIRVAERLKDTPTIPHVRALRQFIEQIRVPSAAAAQLNGTYFDAAASWADLERSGLGNTARAVAALEALLGVLHGRYGDVAALHARPWPRFAAAPFQAQTQIWNLATAVALFRTGGRPNRLALWNMRRLAKLNPADFAHRARLLDAEQARSRGRRRYALTAYERAAAASARSNCLLEHGLVSMLAAEGCESLGALGAATSHRAEAERAWRALGAEALLASRFGAPVAAGPASAERADPGERELQLLAEREAAERTSRAKSRLLATVGHELRTPLQGALGLLELAEETAQPLDVRSLRQAVASLAGVVGDLTDLGALEGGVLSVRSVPFDARAAAASVLALHLPAAQAAERRIVAQMSGAPLWVRGDEGRVRQVLSNLVGNALRHGAGDVHVELVRSGEDRLAYRVTDQGRAPTQAELRRIFEPFERGREQDDGGLGVGLFLGRHLARLMGGDLVVEPGGGGPGKTFRLEIAAPAAEAPAVATGGLCGQRVLIAEDNRLTRQVLAALLRHEGCDVTEAGDGSEAAERLAAETFDLVLLDQHMPGQTGTQVARRLAQHARARPVVVLMSASSDLEAEAVSADAGLDLVLQKPVSLSALRAVSLKLPSSARLEEPNERLAELRLQLGPDARTLLREVRPAVESEIDTLSRLLLSDDLGACSAQLHRLQGLVRHFGLESLEPLVEACDPSDAAAAQALVQRLRQVVRQTDWSRFEGD